MPDIYETIWSNPSAHVSVSRRGQDGQWLDPGATILLDEQKKADGCTSLDAGAPLFARVDETLFDQPTFATFIALLDNYTARQGQPERSPDDPELAAEIDMFLDAIFATEPMRLAFEYVRSTQDPGLTLLAFREQVRRMWFEPYTNNFSGSEPFCVGFEHVFVGEDESGNGGPARCKDQVGGYHSWITYCLDQKRGRVAYLGHDYEQDLASLGLAEAKVVTLLMTWRPPRADGGVGDELLKRPGGFFVGTRPECEVALATVALLDVLADRFQMPGNAEDHRRVRFGDSFFDLVLHPEMVRKSSGLRGPHIRTFYPKFRGNQELRPDRPQHPMEIVPTQPHNTDPIIISRALPNPVGTDERGEWVEVQNLGDEQLELGRWRLTDQEGRPQSLDGTIAAGATRRVAITRADPDGMQLRNQGGWILLFEDTERRAAVHYGRADQGQVFVFT